MRGHNVLTYYPYEHEENNNDEQEDVGILDKSEGDGDLSMVTLNEGGEDDEIEEEKAAEQQSQ